MGPPKRKIVAAPAAAKKPKTNPNFAGVQEALEQADLPESCRQMLIACIGPALGVPSDERQPVQHSMVTMIGECIDAVKGKLQQAVNAEGVKMQELEGAKGELDAKVSEAEAASSEANLDMKERIAKLAEAVAAVRDAKAALQGKENAQREGDKDLNEAAAKLSEMQKAIAEHFKPLADGEEGAGEAHFTALLPLLKGAGVDVSLMSALPSTCAKRPEDRSSFDAMAIEHLGKTLEANAAALQATVDNGAPSARERAAAVDEAKAAVEAAEAFEKVCAEQLAASKASAQEAETSLKAARAAAAARGPELERAAKAKLEREAALENFQGYCVTCFEVLRDARAAKEADAGPSVEAAAAAAGAGA